MKFSPATAIAVSMTSLIASCPRPAGAAVTESNGPGGAAVQVERGRGFGCPAPNTWMMRDGIALCAAPPPPAPAPPPPAPAPSPAPAPAPAPAPPPPNPVPPGSTATVVSSDPNYSCVIYQGGAATHALYDISGGTNTWEASMTVFPDGRRTTRNGMYSPELKECELPYYFAGSFLSDYVAGGACKVMYYMPTYWADRPLRQYHAYLKTAPGVYTLKTLIVDDVMGGAVIEERPYQGAAGPSSSISSCPSS